MFDGREARLAPLVAPWLDQREVAALARTSTRIARALRSLGTAAWRALKLDSTHGSATKIRVWATEGRLADVESVSLAFCHDVSDADLHVLARLPKLRALHLDGCRGLTDAAVDAVAKSCPQLTRLSLYWLPSITDRGALVAASLPALTHLSLSGLKHLSNEGVCQVVQRATKVVELDLTRVQELTDDSLWAISECMPHLHTLRLYACPRITDKGIRGLASTLSKLRVLDLTGANNLTDAALVALGKGCPQLQWLSLQWCLHISDDGVAALAAGCHRIEYLSLHGLKLLTQRTVTSLAQGCPALAVVDLNGIPALHDLPLARLLPSVRVFVKLSELLEPTRYWSDLESVKRFVETLGFDVNALYPDEGGQTVLMFTVVNAGENAEAVTIVDYLLNQRAADMNIRCQNRTPLQVALSYDTPNHRAILRLMLCKNTPPAASEQTIKQLIQFTVQQGSLEDLLVDGRFPFSVDAELTRNAQLFLHMSCRFVFPSLVKEFLQRGADPLAELDGESCFDIIEELAMREVLPRRVRQVCSLLIAYRTSLPLYDCIRYAGIFARASRTGRGQDADLFQKFSEELSEMAVKLLDSVRSDAIALWYLEDQPQPPTPLGIAAAVDRPTDTSVPASNKPAAREAAPAEAAPPRPQARGSPLQLAIETENLHFLSSERVNRIVNYLWSKKYDNKSAGRSMIVRPSFTSPRFSLFDRLATLLSPRKCFFSPRGKFISEMALFFMFVLLFSAMVIERPRLHESLSSLEWVTYVSAMGFLWSEVGEAIGAQSASEYLRSIWNVGDILLDSSMAFVFFLRLAPLDRLHISERNATLVDDDGGDLVYHLLVALVCVGLWLRLLFAFTVERFLGVLLRTIYEMVLDVARFVVLIAVVIVGFALGLYFLVADSSLGDAFSNVAQNTLWLFRAFAGDFDFIFDELDNLAPKHRAISSVFLSIYLFVAAVLMLNLLIALLTTSHDMVQQSSNAHFRRSRVRTIHAYDRRNHSLPPPLTVVSDVIAGIVFASRAVLSSLCGCCVRSKDDTVWCPYCHTATTMSVEGEARVGLERDRAELLLERVAGQEWVRRWRRNDSYEPFVWTREEFEREKGSIEEILQQIDQPFTAENVRIVLNHFDELLQPQAAEGAGGAGAAPVEAAGGTVESDMGGEDGAHRVALVKERFLEVRREPNSWRCEVGDAVRMFRSRSWCVGSDATPGCMRLLLHGMDEFSLLRERVSFFLFVCLIWLPMVVVVAIPIALVWLFSRGTQQRDAMERELKHHHYGLDEEALNCVPNSNYVHPLVRGLRPENSSVSQQQPPSAPSAPAQQPSGKAEQQPASDGEEDDDGGGGVGGGGAGGVRLPQVQRSNPEATKPGIIHI